ncbi:FAD-dependent oxidoreductase [Pullulanibacillus sp. KACC 23026]|uniref:FAD-dependent oxidoreductase n=1 Tax=Pullulanibacillus sp. KACC 23026 TaxID=3028315 RepID=UPI0023B169CC|nr:FAD-dependent oxidoreductase [Pullulanibacillus sp. KACC 23026]WEG14864.1 FAD-dependent oxidoreductase [Pullulanibacillus sp. KACC 23026]
MNTINLFSKGRIGSLELEHRILMGSMHLGIEGDPKHLNQLKAFYVERVKGGAALIITGGVAVLPEGGGDHMFCLTNLSDRSQLKEIVQAVHYAGGKLALQLQHNGRYAKEAETGLTPVAPSPLFSNLTKETPKELSIREIKDIQAAFIEGAIFAKDAGFDAIELMGSEGYLLNQFLSPITNQRTDAYGGTFEKRMKLPLDIVAGIREHVGSAFPLIYRISGNDYMEDSTTQEETMEFAKQLESQGIDALNVGVGWHESRVPTVAASVPNAAFAHVVSYIKNAVSIPVIGANRIHTPEVAEDVLKLGFMDFVAPARPWLADEAFALKAKTNREMLNRCISCNQRCLDHTLGHPPLPVECLVNPRTGHEWEWKKREIENKESQRRQNIAVVGGGVAGLSTAKAAAEQGYKVALFEAQPQLGGHFFLASQIPSKEKFRETIQYYKTCLERLNVDIHLSTKPNIDELETFDKVYLATGVTPYVPEQLKGVQLPHVVTYSDILSGQVPVGKKVAIVGGGGIGCDLAHLISQANDIRPEVKTFFEDYGIKVRECANIEVTLISRSKRLAKNVGPTTRWVLLSELRKLGVTLLKGFECCEITEDGVWVQTSETKQFIKADQVILCTGQTANQELYDVLKDRVPTVLIGGSYDASELNAAKAIHQGYAYFYSNEVEAINK